MYAIIGPVVLKPHQLENELFYYPDTKISLTVSTSPPSRYMNACAQRIILFDMERVLSDYLPVHPFILIIYTHPSHTTQVYVHMIIDTLLIIYIGSQNSVIYSGLMGEAPDGVALERMETQDAYMFPVIGSCVLFGLYCAFKFLPKEYVNIAVKVYFFVIGLFVLGQKLASILAENLPEGSADCLTKKTWQFHIPYSSYLTGAVVPVEEAEQEMTEAVASDDKGEKDAASTGAPEPVGDDDIEICAIDVVGLALAGVIAYWYLTTGHWASSNIFGMAFSIQGIEMLSIGETNRVCMYVCMYRNCVPYASFCL